MGPEAELVIPVVQMGKDQECADHIGNQRGDRDSLNSHMEPDDKHQV